MHVRGLCAHGVLSEASSISLAIDPSGLTSIGEQMRGGYGEFAYNILERAKGTKQELSLFCRYEARNPQKQVSGSFTSDLSPTT